jgi:chlorite dismutase
MRFDRASATYAEFGPFYTGMVAPVDELLARIGVTGS